LVLGIKRYYIVNTGVGDFNPALFLKLWQKGDTIDVPTVRHALNPAKGDLYHNTYKVCEDIEIYPARDLR